MTWWQCLLPPDARLHDRHAFTGVPQLRREVGVGGVWGSSVCQPCSMSPLPTCGKTTSPSLFLESPSGGASGSDPYVDMGVSSFITLDSLSLGGLHRTEIL